MSKHWGWIFLIVAVLTWPSQAMAILVRQEVGHVSNASLEALHQPGLSSAGTGYWGSVFIITRGSIDLDNRMLQTEGVMYRMEDIMRTQSNRRLFSPFSPDAPTYQGNRYRRVSQPSGPSFAEFNSGPIQSNSDAVIYQVTQNRRETPRGKLSDFLVAPVPK